jgi:hypothetical protein
MEVVAMTESQLLELIRRLPPNKAQEVYDFALFLDESMKRNAINTPDKRIEGFTSEGEMIDYINDVGRLVYGD